MYDVSVVPDAPPGTLGSPLPVLALATTAVSRCLSAAAGLAAARGGGVPVMSVRTSQVAAAVTSERWVQVDGAHPGGPATELSRLWPTADGWIRTHGNYPWHRAALLAALGVPDAGDAGAVVAAVGAALAGRAAVETQEAIVAAGGVAAAVGDVQQWRTGPVAVAASRRPLVELEALGDAPARRRDPGPLPASGLRVLDLTRVIAGPVSTRMLAALGADVLRVDPPSHPEQVPSSVDGLLGKRSTVLDATAPDGRARLQELVHEADVVVCGYRPGALDRLRLSPAAVAHDHPGTVVVTLTAWGSTGPWGIRRGFDSLVQAASGIALECAPDPGSGTPGQLPCQLLDHATGYLAAAGALDALARQSVEGGTVGVWVSLARTAQWLLAAPRADDGVRAELAPPPLQSLGAVSAVRPPGSLDGTPLGWSGGDPSYAAAEPAFRPR